MGDLENQIRIAAMDAVCQAIKGQFTGYGSPLHKLVLEVVEAHKVELKEIFDDAICQAIKADSFKRGIRAAFLHKLSREIVNAFAGSADKAFNSMKNDPTIRAKAVLAVEKVVSELSVSKPEADHRGGE